MSDFTVTPESLLELGAALARVELSMTHMKGNAHDFKGTLGGGKVDSEAGDFCDAWNYGVSKLSADLGETIQAVLQAAAKYAKTEIEIAQAAAAQHHNPAPRRNGPN